MATKEDILEQIVEEYFLTKGYFVQHNVKFKPRRDHPDFVREQDSNHSDIDVLAINPIQSGPDAVVAVSCKSWQAGFDPRRELDAIEHNKILSGRERWRTFRELCVPKWSEAFIQKVRDMTGCVEFTHITAVSHIKGQRTLWETHAPFQQAMDTNPVRLLTFRDMLEEIQHNMTTTLASTEVGRMIQMFRAAGIQLGNVTDA